MHRRTLTREKLEKRGIIDPHRCPLCCKDQETIDHLFIDYPFSQEVWTQAIMGLNAQIPQHSSVVSLFITWKDRCPHSFNNNSTWTKIWNEIPKYICWGIWLARNEVIFNNRLLSKTNLPRPKPCCWKLLRIDPIS